LIALAKHLILTTGGYHDREVCALLNSIHPKGGKPWTVETLQQYRAREKARSGGELASDIKEWVDDEIRRRRDLSASPNMPAS
jgi:hypothetical protein